VLAAAATRRYVSRWAEGGGGGDGVRVTRRVDNGGFLVDEIGRGSARRRAVYEERRRRWRCVNNDAGVRGAVTARGVTSWVRVAGTVETLKTDVEKRPFSRRRC